MLYINTRMRPIKVTYNYSINSTAYVAECTYHNAKEKTLIVIGKDASKDVPTNSLELIDAALQNKLCGPSSFSKDHHELIMNTHGTVGRDIEVYSWRL
mgnify:CR=1 FL=1